jgi:dimethylaniline monooxygenase (N-oxide forming)
MHNHKHEKVAIVGAGISGIVTCKTLLDDGFSNVTVFEGSESICGVWSQSRTYPRLSSNSPRGNYSLSDDKLMDKDGKGVWIYAAEIRENLLKYAARHGVDKCCRVNHFVTEIVESNGWMFKFGDGSTFHADVVIVCTGLFSRPRIPHILHQETFNGLVCHSSDVASNVDTILNAKNVVIVGFGKSSLDLAEWIGLESKQGGPKAHLVFRKAHWFVPMSFFGDLNFMKRSGAPGPWWRQVWTPEIRGRSSNSLAREKELGRKVTIEQAIQIGHKIPDNHVLLPKQSFATDANFGVASEHFFPLALDGIIDLVKGAILEFQPESVLVKTEDENKTIPADVVIFATGFDLDFPFFSNELKRKIGIPLWQAGNQDGAPRLLRTSLPVAFRDSPHPILFNGLFNSSSCSINIDVLSHWISDFLLGNLHALKTLPSAQEMDEQISSFQKLDEKWSDKQKISIFGRWIDFADDCLQDMRLQTRRADADWTKDYFALYDASKWSGLSNERKMRSFSKL